MEATSSTETSVGFQRDVQRYITEDRTLNNYLCECLKSYMICTSTNYVQYKSYYCIPTVTEIRVI
jgi:hypothetical protein